MREIDFLPQWYTETRRRQLNMRRQYIALVAIFVAMVTYNAIVTHSISKATISLARAEPAHAEAQSTLYELAKIRSQIAQLQTKAKFAGQTDSKINIAAVLAEMSYLINRNIVIRQVELVAEPLPTLTKDKPKETSVVRVVDSALSAKSQRLFGDVRFKVVISGVAADSSNVAALICKLEDSPYFHQVYPSFSRNTKLQLTAKTADAALEGDSAPPVAETTGEVQASEFEISCFLANYAEAQG